MNNRGKSYLLVQTGTGDCHGGLIEATSHYIVIVVVAVLGLLAILFPIPALLIYTLIITIIKKSESKLLMYLGYFIAINSALAMSILLASRDYGIGQSVGFGSDMIHYANAFDYVASKQWSSWQELMEGVVFRTGGGEPFFWAVVSVISVISNDPKIIHIALSLIGFGLIFLGAQYYSRNGILMLSMYFSTITCYAFQGSALRSGLAFSMLVIAISYSLKKQYYKSSVISLSASVTHFSMLPFFGVIAVINYLGLNARNIGKLAILFVALIAAFLVVSKLGSFEILQGKIDARLDENAADKTSEYQFLFELTAMTLLCYLNRGKLSKNVKILFALFAAIEVIFYLFFPSIFPRLYRYIYAVYFFIFLEFIESWRPLGRVLLVLTTISWGVFIVATRYQSLFHGNDMIEHFAAPWLK